MAYVHIMELFCKLQQQTYWLCGFNATRLSLALFLGTNLLCVALYMLCICLYVTSWQLQMAGTLHQHLRPSSSSLLAVAETTLALSTKQLVEPS